MPKVYLTESERRGGIIRSVINEYIGRRQLIHRAALARRIGMDKQKFYRRFENPDTFTLGELQNMFKSLNFSNEDILRIVKSYEMK